MTVKTRPKHDTKKKDGKEFNCNGQLENVKSHTGNREPTQPKRNLNPASVTSSNRECYCYPPPPHLDGMLAYGRITSIILLGYLKRWRKVPCLFIKGNSKKVETPNR